VIKSVISRDIVEKLAAAKGSPRLVSSACPQLLDTYVEALRGFTVALADPKRARPQGDRAGEGLDDLRARFAHLNEAMQMLLLEQLQRTAQ
jgi:hypothetical protein